VTESRGELPIFSKAYDFLAWLVPLTNNFPRAQRHTVTQRLLDAGLDFLERLVDANNARGQGRLRLLEAADAELDKVRLYLRLAHRWRWITSAQYEHAGRLVAELGRLLGGWQKATRQQPAS
jgi:four helix bundle protein